MTGGRTGGSLAGPEGDAQEGERREKGDWIMGCQGRVTVPQPFLPLSMKGAVSYSPPAGGLFLRRRPAKQPEWEQSTSALLHSVSKNSRGLPQARPLTFLKFNCKLLSQQFRRLPTLA